MKRKRNKLFLAIFSMLLSIYFAVRGIEHQSGIARIGYFLCSIGSLCGSLGYLYEWVKKFKASV